MFCLKDCFHFSKQCRSQYHVALSYAAFYLGVHCLLKYLFIDIQNEKALPLFFLSFSAEVFKKTFQSLSNHSPEVLYPIPDFSSFNMPVDESSNDLIPKQKKPVFLSINRYERKKNLGLALHALSKYYSHIYGPR